MAKSYDVEAAEFDTQKMVKNYYVDGEGYYPFGIRVKLNPTNNDIQLRRELTTDWATIGSAQTEPYTDIEIFNATKGILGTSWKNTVKTLFNNIAGVEIP